MANWALTHYFIEGSQEDLDKIKDACVNHPVAENSTDGWQGNILAALGVEIKPKEYMRGFLQDEPNLDGGVLSFQCEEAYGVTSFARALKRGFPNIRIYWCMELTDDLLFATNDKEGKYFTDRFYVEVDTDGSSYEFDYFPDEESARAFIEERTGCKTYEEYDSYEGKNGEGYIHLCRYAISSFPD